MMNQEQLQIQPEISQAQSSNDEEKQQDSNKQIKVFAPAEYHKAKRNVTKLVKNYFDNLRLELKNNAKLYLNTHKMQQIEAAISAYVGLRYYGQKQKMDLKINAQQNKTKQNKYGIVCYLPESQKIVSYNYQGKVNILQLQKGNYKLPDIATPIPYQNNIYFLDPAEFDTKRKIFVPRGPAFAIGPQGKLQQIAPSLLFRIKSAIVRKGQHVYILGGLATDKKVVTNKCQKYSLVSKTSQQLPNMLKKHTCPSACFVSNNLWVFSQHYLQCFDGEEWREVPLPFAANFLPFQFILPINQDQILIFGGVTNSNEKSREVRIFNVKSQNCTNYGQILPQGISNERSSGAGVVQGCAVGISSVLASLYPQVGIKSNMLQVTYIFESSAYLSSIINI